MLFQKMPELSLWHLDCWVNGVHISWELDARQTEIYSKKQDWDESLALNYSPLNLEVNRPPWKCQTPNVKTEFRKVWKILLAFCRHPAATTSYSTNLVLKSFFQSIVFLEPEGDLWSWCVLSPITFILCNRLSSGGSCRHREAQMEWNPRILMLKKDSWVYKHLCCFWFICSILSGV